ncbi:MAG: hypothetical protein ACYTGV_02445 [Planctomycetota bacterium]|jgi:hypothetical protein
MNRVAALFLAAPLLLSACGGQRSPFLRVTADSGRVYYTDMRQAYRSDTGGFLTFRDLVTREDVRLKNGTYHARECPQDEVQLRQMEYMDNPTKKPRIEDYGE